MSVIFLFSGTFFVLFHSFPIIQNDVQALGVIKSSSLPCLMQKSNRHAKTTILIKAIIFGITNIHGSLNELLYIVLTDNFYSVLFKEFRISSFDVSQRVFDKLVNMINAINLSGFTDLQWKKMFRVLSMTMVCEAKCNRSTFIPEIVCFGTQKKHP